MLEVLRSGQLSLGPRVPAFEQAFAERIGAAHACAVSSGTAGLHLALRAVGVGEGDEVVTSPFSFVASANAVLYERARAGVRRHRPGHAQPRPGSGGRCRDRSHVSDPAGAHLRLPGRSAGVRAARAADRRGRLRGAWRRTCRRQGGGRPRPPGGLRLLREQAVDDGRGRDDHARRRGHEAAGRLRAQPGPGARHGLARSRPPRLQLPPQRRRLGDRPRATRATGRHAREPRTGRRLVSRGARRRRGLELPCPDVPGGDRRGWFVFVVQVPRGRDRDDVIGALRERGVRRSRICRRST